jgi:hypothetical protein
MNKNITQPLRKVLQHVCWWVNQVWCYPRPAASELKTFLWTTEIANEVFLNSTLIEGGIRPWAENEGESDQVDNNAIWNRAFNLIQKITADITKESLWQSSDTAVRKLVRKILTQLD